MDYAEKSILKTLSYSDIFDFPLNKDELWISLIGERKTTRKEFEKALKKLAGKIKHMHGYYCLRGNEKILQTRKNNLPEVEKKLKIAGKAATYLSLIPTILFVGISGGLAIRDVTKEDDIDFFIITKKGKLFTTRFWILVILGITGLRRSRSDKNPANKICVNLLIDETQLLWETDKRDLYVAHEIFQVKPLFERNNTYTKFLESNNWIKRYFQNSSNLEKKNIIEINIKKNYMKKISSILINSLSFETLMRFMQIVYMKRSEGRKSIKKTSLVFHPNDYRIQTLNKLNLKLRQLGLLTNS